MNPEIRLLGVTIHPISKNKLLADIKTAVSERQHAIIAYVNAHAMVLADEQPRFKAFLNHSDLVFTDGFGVRLAARLAGLPKPERMTPPDWIGELFQLSIQNGYRLFLLGARQDVISRAAENVRADFPGINIAGFAHGYFNKEHNSQENAAVVATINQANPQILIIGFGMPAQEFWIEENRETLTANVFLPVGALLDHLGGLAKRPPKWMRDHGLEWLGRLFLEPKRLWKRYLIGLPKFFWLLAKDSFAKGKKL